MPVRHVSLNGIARICHEALRAYIIEADPSVGKEEPPHWEDAPEWMHDSTIIGVRFGLGGERTPRLMHAEWVRQRTETGWVLGPLKDEHAKTHPALVPYDDLPQWQRTKDEIFVAIVGVFKDKAESP